MPVRLLALLCTHIHPTHKRLSGRCDDYVFLTLNFQSVQVAAPRLVYSVVSFFLRKYVLFFSSYTSLFQQFALLPSLKLSQKKAVNLAQKCQRNL